MNERIQKQLALGKDLKALTEKVSNHLAEMKKEHPPFTKVTIEYDAVQCKAFLTLKGGIIYTQRVLLDKSE